jgi:hypothetical protein
MMSAPINPYRTGHHAYAVDADGQHLPDPVHGWEMPVLADFPSMRWNPDLRDFDYGPGGYPEDGGLSQAHEWAARTFASDARAAAVHIRQSIQDHPGGIHRAGPPVATVTRADHASPSPALRLAARGTGTDGRAGSAVAGGMDLEAGC